MSRRNNEPGTFQLLARLPQQILALLKAELDNAKREVAAKAKKFGIGLLAIIVALFFLFFAIGCLVAAAVAGIAVAWPVWLSALVVAFALILLAAAAIFGGIALMRRGVPIPDETLERVESDFDAMSDVKMNASTRTPQPGEKGNWR